MKNGGMFDMATVIFFIYLHYLRVSGYNVTVFDWVCFFAIGLLQVLSWFIKMGVLSNPDVVKEADNKSKRLDDWFRK